jgi:hypothetical protein
MRFALLTLPLVLSACLPAGGPHAYLGSCPAGDLQALVGQSESVAAGITYQGPKRIIYPGMMVTEEYAPERLNIEIDEAGKIARLTCG